MNETNLLHTIYIVPEDDYNDGDRDPNELNLTAFTGSTPGTGVALEGLRTAPITVHDNTTLPTVITGEAKDDDDMVVTMVTEGDTVELSVMYVNEAGTEDTISDTEEFTVSVSVANPEQASDVTITAPADTKFMGAGTGSDDEVTIGPFTLEARTDEDINVDAQGMEIPETLMLELKVVGHMSNGGGEVSETFSIDIVDATDALVSVRTFDDAYGYITGEIPDPLNPGGSFMLMKDELFEYDETAYDVSIVPSVSSEAVSVSSTGSTVTVTAMDDGDAEVTIIATATPKASSLVITQNRSNVAQLKFPVTVVNTELSVTVEAVPPDIMEGGESEITATASREVEASDGEVKINLVVAGDATLEAESITIAVGSMTGSTTLTATQDDDDYDDETVSVAYSGSGIAGQGQLTINVTDNDTAPEPPVVEATVKAKSAEEVQSIFDREISALVGSTWTMEEGALVINVGQMFDYPYPDDIPAIHNRIVFAVRSSNEAAVKATVEGRDSHDITLTPAGVGDTTISVTVTDPETEDTATVMGYVTVSLSDLTMTAAAADMAIEEGGTSSVIVTASRPVDESDGTVSISYTIVGDAEFIDAADPKSVTESIPVGSDTTNIALMALEDDDYDDETVTVVVSGTGIATPINVEIAVIDKDNPPVEATYTLMASADMVAEGGDPVTITAMASAMVDADTMIELSHGAGSASADDYRLQPMMITIAAGSDTGTAMLTANDDSEVEGDETLTLNGMMGNVVVGSVMLTITDNDMLREPTVARKANAEQMILDAVATAAGGAPWMVGGMVATVDMVDLFTADEGAMITYAAASDAAAVMVGTSGTMLMLTPMAEGVATITVTASDSASMDVARVDAAVAVEEMTLDIGVTVSADTVMEGDSVTLTATANRPVGEATMLSVTVTPTGTTAVKADEMITIPMGQRTGTGMVMAVEDDDSADAMVSVVVSGDGIAGGAASFDIAVTDNDPTVMAKSQVEVDAVFTVAVATASGMDGWVPMSQGGEAATLDMMDLFTTNDSPTLEFMAESSAEDMVAVSMSGSMLTLTPMAMGDATISVTATDSMGDMYDTAMVMSMVMVGEAALMVSVSPEMAEIEEGESVEIMAMLNRPAAALVEVMLLPDVTATTAGEDEYSIEPTAMISIMAGDVDGMVTFMSMEDYMVEDMETVKLIARVKDMGDVGTVTVSIMDDDMETTYELTGPMDMNIVEGQDYELTATASQMVHMDTEVMLMRDRAASDADDSDYMVSSIMIMAGETTGTTMLMVTEDNMPDAGTGTNMGESLVLIGSVDGMEIGTLEFTIWDAAVPALPVIAQLLLAAFLAIGGYRRFRRR